MAEFFSLPLNTDQYLADTTHLSTEEHGAYLLLEIAAWRSKGCLLPDDDAFLARLCRCTLKRWKERLRPKIEPFFTVSDGAWTHRKLSESRAHVAMVCEKRRAAANASHKAKPLNVNETTTANAGANGGANAPLTKTKTIQEETQSPIQTQNPIPQTESHNQNGKGAADATPAGSRRYAFEGEVIKLNQQHFDRWKAGVPHVAFVAKLNSRDAWLASAEAKEEDRRSWFHSTPAWLAKMEQAALAELEAARQRGAAAVARCGTTADGKPLPPPGTLERLEITARGSSMPRL